MSRVYSIEAVVSALMNCFSHDLLQAIEASSGTAWTFKIKSRGSSEGLVAVTVDYFPQPSYVVSLSDIATWSASKSLRSRLNSVWQAMSSRVHTVFSQEEIVNLFTLIVGRLVRSWMHDGHGTFDITISRLQDRLRIVVGGAPSGLQYVHHRQK